LLESVLIGLLTGYILSMPPLGPTNLAIISKGFNKEVKAGVAIGAGAGFADMFYIIIAFGGVSLVKSFIPESIDLFISENEIYIKIVITAIGCVIVFFYGLKIMKTKAFHNNKPIEQEIKEKEAFASERLHHTEKEIEKIIKKDPIKRKNGSGIYGNFVAGILLCISSVTIPASWIAIVGYLKSYKLIDSNILSGIGLAFGVMAGTTLWFYTITKFISVNANKITPSTLNKINFSVGLFLIILSAFLVYKVIDFSLSL